MTRRMRRAGTALFCALLFAGSSARSELRPAAVEILRRAEQVRSPDVTYAADFRLNVVDPNSSWKQRTAFYSLVAGGKQSTLVLMREPLQIG